MSDAKRSKNWKAEYREKHPMPIFRHANGLWWAAAQPLLRTQSMGPSTGSPAIPWFDLTDSVKGAYCGINGLCLGDFEMAHREVISGIHASEVGYFTSIGEKSPFYLLWMKGPAEQFWCGVCEQWGNHTAERCTEEGKVELAPPVLR